MTEPITRRQTLQTLIKHGRFLLAIPLTPFFSSWLHASFAQAATEQPKGEIMNQASSPNTLDPYRLPRHVVPIRYDLRLEPDLTAGRFAGQETITLTIHHSTSEIILNAIELDITLAQIAGDSGSSQQGKARRASVASNCVAAML